MRLKKVMAIMLAAGLTVGSVALASVGGSLKGAEAPDATSVPPGMVPGTVTGSDATEAPAESETPSESETPAESETPSESTTPSEPDTPTTSPSTDPTTSPSTDPGTSSNTTKPKKVTLTKKAVKGKAGKIVVTVNKVSGAKGYQIQYATKKTFKNKSKKSVDKFSANTKKVTIKNLKKGTYYVRIRAYKKSGGQKVWGNFSKTISVKVTA